VGARRAAKKYLISCLIFILLVKNVRIAII